jgi:hypothetical protein
MNIITVVFRGDLANLLYQAHSLKLNWTDSSKKWHIIVEDEHITAETKSWCVSTIAPIMQGWQVEVTTAPSFIKSTSGWHRQQILKLWAAAESDSEYSLVLDGKNFLLYPIDSAWFFVDNKLKVQVHSSDNLSSPWHDCCKFFGKDYTQHVRPFNLTPWVFQRDLAQHTIDQYRQHGCDIFEVEQLPAFEFEAYWLLNQHSIAWEKTDFLDGVMAVPSSLEFLNQRIAMHREFKKPFWLFHRYGHVEKELVSASNNYLKECGIITDDLIEQWQATTQHQVHEWPNIMAGTPPPDFV